MCPTFPWRHSYGGLNITQNLLEDFKFVDDTMDEEKIKQMSKIEYKKKVTEMVTKATFKYFTKEKEGHKKIKDLE